MFESTGDFNPRVEDEQQLLEKRLLEQQRQSEEDSRWLAREEVRKINWILNIELYSVLWMHSYNQLQFLFTSFAVYILSPVES